MRAVNRLHEDEQGVTAVLLALLLVVLMGAGAVVVDLGNMWRLRRVATTSTDAASLAEANRQAFVDFPTGECSAGWQDMLDQNVDGEDVVHSTCTVQPTGLGTGYVVVETEIRSETFFGRALGLDPPVVYSSSGAMYGYTTEASGLRPIALCATNPHISAWLTNTPTTGELSPEGWPRMWFNPTENVLPCGEDSSGNWGWVDFTGDGGGMNEPKEIEDWLLNGFWDFPVSVDDCNGSTPEPDRCPGQPGERATHGKQIQTLCDNETKFWAVVFDDATEQGNNASFQISGFAPLVVRGFQFPTVGGGDRHRWNPTTKTCEDTGEKVAAPYADTEGAVDLSLSAPLPQGSSETVLPMAGTKEKDKDNGDNGQGNGDNGQGNGDNGQGNGGGPAQSLFLEFELHDELLTGGPCCVGAAGGSRLPKAIRRCAVDHDTQSLLDRCSVS